MKRHLIAVLILILLLVVLPCQAAMLVQQSVVRNVCFFVTDSADHVTGKASLNPTVTLSKNGAGFGAAAGAVTEVGGAGNGVGWYQLAATIIDTGTLGQLVIHATAVGADPADMLVEVVAFDPQAVAVGAAVAGNAMTLAGNAVDAAAIKDGAIDAATFAAGAIDAAAIKDAAIDNATFAADVGTTALLTNPVAQAAAKGTWDSLTADHSIASTYGQQLEDNLNASVGSRAVAGDAMNLANDAITAAKIAPNAINSSEAPNLDAAVSSRAVAGDAMNLANDAITAAKIAASAITSSEAPNLDAAVSSRGTSNYAGGAVASVTGDVGGKVLGGGAGVISATGAQAQLPGDAISAATIAAGAITSSEAPNLDAAVSSRSTYAGGAVASVTGSVGSVAGDVGGKVLGGGAGVIAATGVQAQIPAGGIGTTEAPLLATLPKLDSGLVADGPLWQWTANSLELGPAGDPGLTADAVWDEATALHVGVGSFGEAMAADTATLAHLDTTLELDGVVYRFTLNALEEAPGAVGATDWTAAQKTLILNTLSRILAQVGGG